MDLKDYLAIVRRRWYLFFPIIVATLAVHVLWVEYGQADRYEAVSKVFVTPSAGPTRAERGILTVRAESIRSVGSFRQTILDTPVQAEAARLLLGEVPFESAEFRKPQAAERIRRFVETFRRTYGPERRRALIEEIAEAIQVEGDDEIVSVTATADSAEKALAISWAAVEGACRYHKQKASEGARAVAADLDRLQDRVAQELRDAETAWSAVCKEKGFDPVRMDQALGGEIIRLKDEKDALEARIKEVDGRIREALRARPFETIDGDWQGDLALLEDNPRYLNYRKLLLDAQLELDAKRVLLSPLHPDIQDLVARIRATDRKLQELVEAELPKSLERKRDQEMKALVADARDLARKLEIQKTRIQALQEKRRELAGVLPSVLPVRRRYETAKKRLDRIVDLSNDVNLMGYTQLGSVRVYDPEDEARLLPRRGSSLASVMLAGLMAMILALGIVSIAEYIDTRVKSEHDIRRYLNLPLLAVIPRKRSKDLIAAGASSDPDLCERFNTAATLIRTSARELGMKSFLIGSATPQEGKTTVAVNLAAALARKGTRVVLVDADLRIPQIHTILGLSNGKGLSTLLEGRIDPESIIEGDVSDERLRGEAIVVEDCLQPAAIENLYVLPAGPVTGDPVHLLESDRLPRIVRKLSEWADFVIFDSPPINKVGDGLTVASIVDGSVLVVGAGHCDHHDVAWAKHLLANVQANVLGVILNKRGERTAAQYYDYAYAYRRSGEHVPV